jgi:hypothetical protein
VVSPDHGAIHFLDDLDALMRVGVVADDIAEAYIVSAFPFAGIGEHRLSGLQIGVEIAQYCKAHDGGGMLKELQRLQSEKTEDFL